MNGVQHEVPAPVAAAVCAQPWTLVALAQLQAGIVVLDADGRVVFVNEWFLARSGHRAEELLGRRLADVMQGAGMEAFWRRLQWAQQTGFPALLSHSLHSPPLPLYVPHAVGHPSAVLSQTVHIMPMGRWTQHQGAAALTLVQVTDVTPTVRRESVLRTRVDQMHSLARVDALTGVGNRRAFTETLEIEVRAAIRARQPLGLLMIDIDHFKRYNDHYGHPAGDECLREVAQLLQTVVRRPRDRLVRYGGEEFAILLPHTPMEGALEVGREALNRIRRLGLPHEAHPNSRIVTLSVGVASLLPQSIEDGARLVAMADEALYVAKSNGRDQLSAWREQAAAAAPPSATEA